MGYLVALRSQRGVPRDGRAQAVERGTDSVRVGNCEDILCRGPRPLVEAGDPARLPEIAGLTGSTRQHYGHHKAHGEDPAME